MYGELFRSTDVRKDTGHPDIFIAVPEESDIAILKDQMSGLRLLSELPEPGPILKGIRKLIPAYTGDPFTMADGLKETAEWYKEQTYRREKAKRQKWC